jgi:predicted cation transporter
VTLVHNTLFGVVWAVAPLHAKLSLLADSAEVGVLVLVVVVAIMAAKLAGIVQAKVKVVAVLHTDLHQAVLRIYRLGLAVAAMVILLPLFQDTTALTKGRAGFSL